MTLSATPLAGRKGLVVGIANADSIATGCARAFREAGADLAVTYLNEKALKYVEPVATALEAPIVMPLDVTDEAQIDAVFARIASEWGRLDFLLHSIAYCRKDDLTGRVVDTSRDGFAEAMDISVHSLFRLLKRAEPLMSAGGSVLTVSYYGAEKVVDNYNIMGPVKAALESSVRYLAAELGPKGIRVNALSPGPLKTRAASGIAHFDALVDAARLRAPAHQIVTIEDIGAMARYYVSDEATRVTGNVAYIDGGMNVMA